MDENTPQENPVNPEEGAQTPVPQVQPSAAPQSQEPQSAQPVQAAVTQNPAPAEPASTQATPSAETASSTEVTPAAVDATKEEKKELTPEEKKAKRKQLFKRLGLLVGIFYLLEIIGVFVYGFTLGEKELAAFDSLPISQAGFENFLMLGFNVLMGFLVGVMFLFALVSVLRSLLIKKDKIEKKKKASKSALWGGIGFFLVTAIWLTGLILLAPRLITEDLYTSYILTDPEETIGLSAPVVIEFDASALPISSAYEVLSYGWTFGDGDSATGVSVSHQYTSKGDDGRYTVILEVELRDVKTGEIVSEEFTKEIGIDNETVSASFTATPTSGDAPLDVYFDASGSYDGDGEIVSYEWDFDGDGRYDEAEGVQVEYTFEQEGEFEVELRVTDSNNDFAVVSETIEVGSNGGLQAVITSEDISPTSTFEVGVKYSFTGEDSQSRDGNITRFTWDFGDGSETVTSRSTTHSFDEPGDYTLVLTVEDAQGNEDSDSIEITVGDAGNAPIAAADTSDLSGPLPLTVEFDASASEDLDDDIIEYEWDFDSDGEMDDAGERVDYTYDEIGFYTATLTVTDSEGSSDTTSFEVEVTEQGVVADLQVDLANGETPLTVSFDASGSTYREGNIVSYEYDFGDGGEGHVGSSSISYKYTDVGTFTATVTVVGDDGMRDTSEVQIVVRPVSMTACFTVNTDQGSAPLFVSVDPSCSTGTIDTYEWDFGDGEISFDRKPETHVYSETGTYVITLEVTGETGIVSTFTKEVEVN